MKTLRHRWGHPTPESAAVVEQLNQRIQQDILCTSAMTPNSLQHIFPSTDKKQNTQNNQQKTNIIACPIYYTEPIFATCKHF